MAQSSWCAVQSSMFRFHLCVVRIQPTFNFHPRCYRPLGRRLVARGSQYNLLSCHGGIYLGRHSFQLTRPGWTQNKRHYRRDLFRIGVCARKSCDLRGITTYIVRCGGHLGNGVSVPICFTYLVNPHSNPTRTFVSFVRLAFVHCLSGMDGRTYHPW